MITPTPELPPTNLFRKKPVVVQATQYTAAVRDAHVLDKAPLPPGVYIVATNYHPIRREVYSAEAYIDTLEGRMAVSLDDWVITGVKGENYACKPDIFEATYEPAIISDRARVPSDAESERAAFEAAYIERHGMRLEDYDFTRRLTGYYQDEDVQTGWDFWQARALLAGAGSSGGSDSQTLIDAYALGWHACSGWAERDDLVSDIGSPAYIAEREKMLSGMSTSTAKHDSDCALHNEPAYPAGPCNCRLSASTAGAASPTLPAPVAPTGAPS